MYIDNYTFVTGKGISRGLGLLCYCLDLTCIHVCSHKLEGGGGVGGSHLPLTWEWVVATIDTRHSSFLWHRLWEHPWIKYVMSATVAYCTVHLFAWMANYCHVSRHINLPCIVRQDPHNFIDHTRLQEVIKGQQSHIKLVSSRLPHLQERRKGVGT